MATEKVLVPGTNGIPVEKTIELGGGGHTILNEGQALAQQTDLDFRGAGVIVTDDSENGKTLVAVPGESVTLLRAAVPQITSSTDYQVLFDAQIFIDPVRVNKVLTFGLRHLVEGTASGQCQIDVTDGTDTVTVTSSATSSTSEEDCSLIADCTSLAAGKWTVTVKGKVNPGTWYTVTLVTATSEKVSALAGNTLLSVTPSAHFYGSDWVRLANHKLFMAAMSRLKLVLEVTNAAGTDCELRIFVAGARRYLACSEDGTQQAVASIALAEMQIETGMLDVVVEGRIVSGATGDACLAKLEAVAEG